jgi:GNAT superfamily N-acetyltransferase
MNLRIRRGRVADAERLRELTEASKAHWGYDRDFVRRWASGLDLSAESPRWGELYVAEVDGDVVAWAGLIPQGKTCVLDDLWVDPPWIGKGVGSELFRFAAERARGLGARRLEWGAEPNAVGFYERLGGRRLRDHVSEWGRVTPWMGLELDEGSY